MRNSPEIHFIVFLILFIIASYGSSLPSVPFPPLKVAALCDFTWYTSPEVGNPLYGLRNSEGILSHAASGRCVPAGSPICKGFTVFPPSWQNSGCLDSLDGSQVPCCIRDAACVQADVKVTSFMKKGVCQDAGLPCDRGIGVSSDDCPYDNRYDTQTTCCLPYESFQELRSSPQIPEGNIAANVIDVALPPNPADDLIDGNISNLPSGSEKIVSNAPGEVYNSPIYVDF